MIAAVSTNGETSSKLSIIFKLSFLIFSFIWSKPLIFCKLYNFTLSIDEISLKYFNLKDLPLSKSGFGLACQLIPTL